MPNKSTRQRLLEAASQEFMNMGYAKARIREIAGGASANLAAVNYYFGSKAKLYCEVFEYLFRDEQIHKRRTVDTADPEQAFREEASGYLNRLNGPDKTCRTRIKLLCRELREPSELFPVIYEKVIAPRLSRLAALVEKLSGYKCGTAEHAVRMNAVLGQALFYSENMDYPTMTASTGVRGADGTALIVNLMLQTLNPQRN